MTRNHDGGGEGYLDGQTHLTAGALHLKKEYERGIVWRWCFQHAVLELTVNWRTID